MKTERRGEIPDPPEFLVDVVPDILWELQALLLLLLLMLLAGGYRRNPLRSPTIVIVINTLHVRKVLSRHFLCRWCCAWALELVNVPENELICSCCCVGVRLG